MKDINILLGEMTLEEKISLLDGRDFWHTRELERHGVPSIMLADGPHGLRKHNDDPKAKQVGLSNAVPAVCFPTACTTACSWDEELLYEMGEALGEKAAAENVAVLLGPGVNMKRSPLCGRNFEYFSEDPYLAGKLAAALIRGVQSRGIGTSLKHFAVNNQETRRMTVDAVVDERALREIYLTAFEIAVKEGRPWTVMSAYNRLNGEYCSENKYLLKDILRGEWGFDGLIMSDWGAVSDRVRGVEGGNDLEMPSSFGVNAKALLEAVQSGKLEEKYIDECAFNVLAMVKKAVESRERRDAEPKKTFDEKLHHALARKIAAQSMVLMKNEDKILPLAKGTNLAVIGELAVSPRFQGAGSSFINANEIDSAVDALTLAGFKVNYSQGYKINSTSPDEKLITAAAEAARKADTAVVFMGLTSSYEAEGFDRKDMTIPESHVALLEAVSKANERTVVVLAGGSPVEMPWIGNAKALLNSYLGGQAGAGAVADILCGEVNPSGKLAETYPYCHHCSPCVENFPGGEATVEYRESIFIGYRYYQKVKKEVAFPFGFGLSYTDFEYSDLVLDKHEMHESHSLSVKMKLRNSGEYDGVETVELYVADKDSTLYRPERELRAFKKVFLKAGEEKTIEFVLSKRDFSFYNPSASLWQTESGEFDILIGASCEDIRLSAAVTVVSDIKTSDFVSLKDVAPAYYTGDPASAPAEQFEAVLGRTPPPAQRDKKLPLDMTCSFEMAEHTKWGRRINKTMRFFIRHFVKGDDQGAVLASSTQLPLKDIVFMSGALFTPRMAQGLLMMLNSDHAGKGFRMILGGLPHLLCNIKKLMKMI